MSSILARIFQQAAVTFNTANRGDLQRNLGVLKSMVDKVKFSDLNLDERIVSKSFFSQPDKAPCTFVGIYEDPHFSMSVFVLAENYTMPSHDHPNMHGLLKAISGQLRIQSYTYDKDDPLDVLDKLYALNPNERPPAKKSVHCRREPILEVDENSPAVLLTPDERNIHQITAIGGPVAFFDILSPPYDTTIEARPQLKRKCTFFREAQSDSIANGVDVVLDKIPQPLNYYCDNVEYR